MVAARDVIYVPGPMKIRRTLKARLRKDFFRKYDTYEHPMWPFVVAADGAFQQGDKLYVASDSIPTPIGKEEPLHGQGT